MGTSPPGPSIRTSRPLGAREATGTKEGSLLSLKAPRTPRWAERPVACPREGSCAAGQARCQSACRAGPGRALPGRGRGHSLALGRLGSMLILSPWQQVPAAAGLGSASSLPPWAPCPPLLWGLELRVAPRAPGCQTLVPPLKGLEQGGEGEARHALPACAVCAQRLWSLWE